MDQVRSNQKVAKQKEIIKSVLACELVQNMSISDFGNHINVIAGLILQAQKAHTNEMKVSDLTIDLDVKDAPHPEVIKAIYEMVKDEKDPEGVSSLLVKVVDHVSYQIKEVAFIERKISEVSVEEMIK